jgi:MFS family permease
MRAVRRAAIVLIGWGLLLGLATAVQTPFGPRIIEFGLLGGASAACLASGIAMWAWDAWRHSPYERPRLLADNSFATVTLVLGAAVALIGAGFGLWLILIGAGIAALGAGGLVREALARRRSARPLQLRVHAPRRVPRARREGQPR